MKWLNKKGFTLLELLVVLLIIGILSAIALPQYKKTVEKTRVANALLIANNLQKAIDAYVLTKGYPNNTVEFLRDTPNDVLDIDIQGLECKHYACLDNFFAYYASCTKNGCYISIAHQPVGDNSYDIGFSKRKEEDGWEKLGTCSEKFEWLCIYLESLGFDRDCC